MNRLAGAALAGALLFLGFLEVVAVRGLDAQHGYVLAGSLVLSVAAVALAHRRDALAHEVWLRATLGLSAASALLTLVSYTSAVRGLNATLEGVTLLILLVLVAKRWQGIRETVVLIALVTAAVVLPYRSATPDSRSEMVFAAVAGVIALMVGWSLRERDLRLQLRLIAVRNEERHEIARDLHDEVAHHVTGIIVAAQAASLVSGRDPAATRAAFERIERAGVEALESMRSIVSVLRIPGQDDSAQRTAARWPDDLVGLVERFERNTGLNATLAVEVDTVPTVYCQAVQRVTQEALTNVSRHARGATRADVVIGRDEGGLHVTITDDGRIDPTARSALGSSGGGFGLVGVRERAAALGGRVTAGRHGSGGWQVEVVLPVLHTAPRTQVGVQ